MNIKTSYKIIRKFGLKKKKNKIYNFIDLDLFLISEGHLTIVTLIILTFPN